jgi:hypothetical protein
VYVWSQQLEQGRHRRLGKDHDVVDASERGDELRPIGRGEDRSSRALTRGRRIVIDRDDETIGFCRRPLDVADMANVQEIETTIRKGNRTAFAAICGDEINESFACDDHLLRS